MLQTRARSCSAGFACSQLDASPRPRDPDIDFGAHAPRPCLGSTVSLEQHAIAVFVAECLRRSRDTATPVAEIAQAYSAWADAPGSYRVIEPELSDLFGDAGCPVKTGASSVTSVEGARVAIGSAARRMGRKPMENPRNDRHGRRYGL